MPRRQKPLKQGLQGQVRIIGGEWRGRKLPVPEGEGLRPTSDRVRETLFNWLQFSLAGRRCLDAFTGSGALAIEALSRGAAQVTAIERDPKVTKQLRELLTPLAGKRLQLLNADVLQWLEGEPEAPFDLVFLDPPFHQGLLEPTCQLLEQRGWLADNALIYIEQEKQGEPITLPPNWSLQKDKQAGEVRFGLYAR
ncbi:MAG: 16S rRNA (guanine(966)-N(2))-methyltransferase RsmD [Marinospirillum sp.]|uniref:16S rRNA (guanine(966)-N(2))-methyltransferase RsmD n=1 Tax=Marinospirillum sp. TaxID=2183934 RepID=UPI001A0FB589|nr:16S rRNA (guanine(966)-N(2))-methyltransferase RsmD [Marinospirillum sp.]MBE0505548.1 16S rRNA (guanine(966)-N(2))-methyltransferase RsmD [Marinospirillum sp.]